MNLSGISPQKQVPIAALCLNDIQRENLVFKNSLCSLNLVFFELSLGKITFIRFRTFCIMFIMDFFLQWYSFSRFVSWHFDLERKL